MSSSLAAFLDRRKKSTVKAAALLVQTEEAIQDKAKANAGSEESQSEQQSDHDDEWKVSDDETTEAYKRQAATSQNLLLTIKTIATDGSDDRGAGSESKPTQHMWQPITQPPKEPEAAKVKEEKEDTAKIWVPKFRSGSKKNSAVVKDDIDLAEAARILSAKNEPTVRKQTKKVKEKKIVTKEPAEEEKDTGRIVKIKFNLFSVVGEKYHTFSLANGPVSADAEKVKEKYIAKAPYAEVV